ncbi:MAG: META domain-containing protein [Xanthobacteraceae bacterium]
MSSSILPVAWVRAGCLAAILSLSVPGAMARDVAKEFPFDQSLMLDTLPMRGSKRVPMLEIAKNGAVLIDLWCNSVQGHIVVVDDTITILAGPKTDRPCPPERAQGDEEVLSSLMQVTKWRREGNDIVLIGPQTLRFHKPSN